MDPTPSTIAISRRRGLSGARGFTLIEVLVALAVIAIGLLAVLTVAAHGVRVSTELQQRNFANWIAQNEIARLRLAPQWPDLGEANDEVDFANQKWRWDAETEKTPDPDLRRVTITVALADKPDESITRMIAFIGQPPPKPVQLPLGTAKSSDSDKTSPP